MLISIHDKSTLDAFAQRVASQTSMSPSRLKTAIAKAYSFSHITAFESALGAAKNTPAQVEVPALTSEEATVLGHIADWLQDNVALGDCEIMFGDFNSDQMDDAMHRLLRQEKQPTLVITEKDRAMLEAFLEWLEDGASRDICFDNDDEVGVSQAESVVSAVLNKLENSKASGVVLLTRDEVADECLAHYEVDSEDELEQDHYEQAEDALLSTARDLVGHPDLANAISALQHAGFKDLAEQLVSLNTTVLRCDYLSNCL